MNFKTKKRKNKLLKYINKAEEGGVNISYLHLYRSVTCVVTPGKKRLREGRGRFIWLPVQQDTVLRGGGRQLVMLHPQSGSRGAQTLLFISFSPFSSPGTRSTLQAAFLPQLT